MALYLTQEWLDLQKKLANETQPERPKVNARIQHVVTGTPSGDVKYYWILEKGKLSENKLGDLPDADITLTTKYDDAVRIQKGELNANVAFMQGKVKVSGNMPKMLGLLPLTASSEYQELQKQVLEVTDF